MSDQREIEAKFEGEPATLEALLALEEFGSFRRVEKATSVQDDLYYDTDDSRLKRAGASLRIRRKSAGAEMTFKGDRQSAGNGHTVSRLEDEVDLPAHLIAGLTEESPLALDEAPSPLLRAREVAGGQELLPVARLNTNRTKLLFNSSNDQQIELAVDRCIAVRLADGREVEFVEVEAELKRGDANDLSAAMEDLVDSVPGLRPSSNTKLERALG